MIASPNPLRTALRRFRQAKDGATAIEFALVIIPFFFLTFGLAEVSMIAFAQSNLDFAVSNTAREIRTGQAQMGGASYAEIKAELCSSFASFMAVDCAANLYLDIDTYASFVGIDTDPPISGGELQTGGFGYDPGAPSSIVVVRAFYRWELMTPLFDTLLANAGGNDRIVISTMMFRNEPYQ